MIDIDPVGKLSPGFRALEIQSGISESSLNHFDADVRFMLQEQKCMDVSSDIMFIGADWNKSNQEAINYLTQQGSIVIGNWMCQPSLVDELHAMI